jgi:hypothetical protein
MHVRAFIVKWLVQLILPYAFAINAQPLPTQIVIDPQATYLRVNNDPAANASPIDLGVLGIFPGDLIRLRALGSFQNGPGLGYINGMIGMFSSNSVLLASSLLNRVPGAIAAGTPYVTPVTFSGSLPTDIPQDFFIASLTNISIHVPFGAAYIFVSAKDTKFSDNFTNPTNNFRILIDRGTEAVVTASIASPNTVSISWNADSNQWYQVQSSFLLSNDWVNLGPPILGTGSMANVTNSTSGMDTVFYRVKRVL